MRSEEGISAVNGGEEIKAQLPGAPQVLCFGEALIDRLFPAAGATDVIRSSQPPAHGGEDHVGGAPANVACALARLGTPSALIGRLGRDAGGEAIARLLHARGVGTSALQWDPARASRLVLVRRDAGGERSFTGFGADGGSGFADQAISIAELAEPLEALLPQARWLVSGTIPLASPAAAEALRWSVQRAQELRIPLAVDVNWRACFWDRALAPTSPPSAAALAAMGWLLERAALVKCSAEEAHWLFGGEDPTRIRASLPGHPDVLITDGDRPLHWCVAGQSGELDSFPVPVVDSTGAGDAFTAGWLHGLCAHANWSLGQRLRFASACGALVCQGAGAIDPQPDELAVLAFLAANPASG
jgi:fructokinase